MVTIRKFPDPITIEKLIRFQALTEEAAQFLEQLVKAKYNLFVCGGTNSGKTTFLNALSSFIPETERVITIEDSAELQITHVPNLVRLETRNANTEGEGEITISQLIKASLRMNPSRIIVGEVRGAEALDMLQAMNTGHPGSLSTGHGNSPQDMLSRLEVMVLMGAELPLDAIRSQIASALDIMVHLGRLKDGSRKVLSIVEIGGYKNGKVEQKPLFVYDREEKDLRKQGNLRRGKNLLMQEINRKRWSRSSGREKQKEDLNGRARPPDYREYQLSQKEWMQYLIMGAGAAGLCAYTFYRSVLAFLFLLPEAFLYPVYKKKDLKKNGSAG